MKTTLDFPNECWNCGRKNDAVSDIEGNKAPSPGSVAFCIGCAVPGIFDDNMVLREPTKAEFKELLKDHRVIEYMWAILLARITQDLRGTQ